MTAHDKQQTPSPSSHEVGSEPIGYCVWITPTKLAACAKSARGAFPVYAAPAAPKLVKSEFCGCMAGPNDPDPACKVCGGSGDASTEVAPSFARLPPTLSSSMLTLTDEMVMEALSTEKTGTFFSDFARMRAVLMSALATTPPAEKETP